MTLRAKLNGRENSLNIVRLLLAVMVVVGHAEPLTGRTYPIPIGYANLAVDAFFAVSGYLIAASRLTNSLPAFAWRRFLRIYPGFVACLVATVVLFVPIVAKITGDGLSWHDSARFLVRGTTLAVRDYTIPGTLADNPLPGLWNGSLWTLFFEVLAYVFLGALLTVPAFRRKALWVVPAMFAAFLLARPALPMVEAHVGQVSSTYANILRLFGYFLAGAAVYFWADRIRLRPWHLAGCAAVICVVRDDLWLQLPIAVLTLGLGSIAYRGRLLHTDVSYGMYIYAFPVQQSFVALGSAALGPGLNAVLTTAATTPIALLSWRLVERPAMRLRRLVPSRRPVDTSTRGLAIRPTPPGPRTPGPIRERPGEWGRVGSGPGDRSRSRR